MSITAPAASTSSLQFWADDPYLAKGCRTPSREDVVRPIEFFGGTPARFEVTRVGFASNLLLSRVLFKVEAAVFLYGDPSQGKTAGSRLQSGRGSATQSSVAILRNGWKADVVLG